MKQMLRKKDVWVLLAALIGAFACVTLIQFISGRIDGVASMVFLLAVFFVSMYTDGYWWGVAGSVISVLAVNFAFRTPYFAFNFTIPENIFSGVVMLVVSFMTSTLTTRIKKQEQLRMESETEKMRANLLRAVSHDLRTPLTMMKGYSEVMRDLPGENTPENVQIIIDEAERLTNLVNDLLDLSKLEAGVLPLEKTRFNLTESIRGILHRYDKLADYHFPFLYREEVWVDADELKISQVVYNLVNNAINYSGGNKTVYIDQTVTESTVRVSIRDTGEGIPADKLQYIWDRYYKVDKEHKRAQVGTGLGLSIVKKILDLHGGRYGVASVEGKGSTFWFELPVLRLSLIHI